MRRGSWLLLLLLTACAAPIPPDSPTVWGLPYQAVEVAAGSLAPLAAYAGGRVVRIESGHISTRMVAHELTHIWQQTYLAVPASFWNAACIRQPAWNCSMTEAHADAVGQAAVDAGCTPGDFGWPGWEAARCLLPDPLAVRGR